jgi:DNA-binding LacI/PurR family transcriptional regulator
VVVGIVVRRPPREHGGDPFFAELIAGMEDVLVPGGGGVLLHVAVDQEAELAALSRWAADARIAGAVLGDLVDDDPRPGHARALGLPALALGGTPGGVTVPSIPVDNATPVLEAMAALAALGHRRISRVSGPLRLGHTRERSQAFDRGIVRAGLTGRSVESDYSARSGDAATRALLADEARPTAILYDNDLAALGGLAAARALGVPVPERLSLLAWDDSELCRLADPPLSAMSRDVRGLGVLSARALLAVIAGEPLPERVPERPRLVLRGTTARAPR